MALYETAGQILQDAASEIGLQSLGADPYANTDFISTQLATLLKQVARRKLIHGRDWKALDYQYTFNTVTSQGVYSLPTDFKRVVDQTGWNRTNRLPPGGPLTRQEWQYLKARLLWAVFT